MERILEAEVMDSPEEAIEYDSMDFTEVNLAFTRRVLQLTSPTANILDAGTGTARIPISIAGFLPDTRITAVDLAGSMLEVAARNVEAANLGDRILLERVDAKKMPYENDRFDLVISNSLVHHLGDPLPFFQEIERVLKPDGALLIRDLLRPADEETIKSMVASIGPEYSPHQAKLFQDSLRAAFTLDEIENLLALSGLENLRIYRSSDRHWTAERSAAGVPGDRVTGFPPL